MSTELQVMLWILGAIGALVVPAACWGINVIITLRSEVTDNRRKIAKLGTSLRRLTVLALEERDRKTLETYLDGADL